MPHDDRPTLLFLVTEDWYFLSHRLPMARAAMAAGFRVAVATRVDRGAEAIRAAGVEVIPVPMDRASLSPLKELGTVLRLVRVLARVRPVVLHNVAIKPIVLGSVAATVFPRLLVLNAFAGLGTVLGEEAPPSRLRTVIHGVLRRVARRRRVFTLTQNEDDRRVLLTRRLAMPARTALIRGSGVALDHYRVTPEPPGPPVALMVARLLRDKGVVELVEAARLLRNRGRPARVWIAGEPDPTNANSVPAETLDAWRADGLVELLGRRDDIAALWRDAHIAVLPSYGEGLPKSLLEAAASGRPLVTTTAPGCRDLVPEGRTGLLVPPRDAGALADALDVLAADPDRRRALGLAARAMVESQFSAAIVGRRTERLYRDLLDRRALAPATRAFRSARPWPGARPPRVSVGLVTYNNADVIEAAVDSLAAADWSGVDGEVVVRDNGSGDDTPDRLARLAARHGSRLRLLPGGDNVGFGRGHNAILEAVDSDLHVICNPDVTVPPDILAASVAALRERPDVALVAPRLSFPDGRPQPSLRRDPTVLDLALRRILPGMGRRLLPGRMARYEMADSDPSAAPDVPVCTGAVMVCRTEALREVGGFDARYFLYFEDADLCRTLRLAGWRVVHDPAVTARHVWARAPHHAPRMTAIMVRSALRYFLKWGVRWL